MTINTMSFKAFMEAFFQKNTNPDPAEAFKETGFPYMAIRNKKRIDDTPMHHPAAVAKKLATRAQSELYKAKKLSGMDIYSFMAFDRTDNNIIILTAGTQEEIDVLRTYFLDNEFFELVYG